jgi:hypothetical protein
MEKFIIETPYGYVEALRNNDDDVRFTGVLNRAMHFDTSDEAWDFVDEYFTDDYDEQEALGIYVNKVDYSELTAQGPEEFIITTALGYVAGLKDTTDPSEREKDVIFVNANQIDKAMRFASEEEAEKFIKTYVDVYGKYMGTEAGAYVRKVDAKKRPEAKSSGINIELLGNEVDSLLDLINDQLGDDSPVKGKSLDGLLSIASKLLGK